MKRSAQHSKQHSTSTHSALPSLTGQMADPVGIPSRLGVEHLRRRLKPLFCWRQLRRCLCHGLAALLVGTAGPAIAAESERWPDLRATYFGERPIVENSDVIALEAPGRAHDAAVVPIKVVSLDAGRQMQRVHLLVDQNPLPLAGIFTFTEASSDWSSFETRIRINEYTHVRAIGELSDGSLHMASSFVKASGGCSAPALADMDAAMANAGKMRLLLDDIAGDALGAEASPVAAQSEAIIKISHPNNSGMQFDQVSRNYIPAFYVHTIGAELDGKPLLDVETNFSLSENPVVDVKFRDPMDRANLLVYALDSKGNRYEQVFSAGE